MPASQAGRRGFESRLPLQFSKAHNASIERNVSMIPPLARAFVFSIAPILACSIAYSSELVVTSKVTAVTVYSDRALISRAAKVSLGAGEQNVVFASLPAALFD